MNESLAIPASQARVDWRTPLELLALGAIWGGSFLFMRVAASDLTSSAATVSCRAWRRRIRCT